MIFYFSGTGNSKWIASKVATYQNEKLISIAEEMIDLTNTFQYSLEDSNLTFCEDSVKNKQSLYKWLYETYENDLFSYGIAFGISKELLEDAIHDVFLHLYEREHKLWESQNMKFYLLNCLKNRIRTIKKKEMNTEFLEEGSDNYSFLIEVNGFELIDEEKERAAMQKQLKKMLDSLTDRQREAVYLRYTQGLSYEEIGKLMGIQPKAAQKLVYRAIEQMRKIQPQIIYFFLFGYFL